MRIFLGPLLTLFLFSCAANQHPAELDSAGALSVDGLSIWDGRRNAVPVELAAGLQKAEALWAEAIPTCKGPDSIACFTKTTKTWLSSQRRELGALEKQLASVGKADPAQRLAVLIILAKSYDSMAQKLRSMPMPEHLRADLEMSRIFRLELKRSTLPLRIKAGMYWKQCTPLAHEASPILRGWADECAKRAASAEEEKALLAPVQAKRVDPPARKALVWPNECQGAADFRDPQAPKPDYSKPWSLLVLSESLPLSAGEADQVTAAATRRVGQALNQAIVSEEDLRWARQLFAERRPRPGGPICGQPLPLPALLALRHPHLVLGHLEGICNGRDCSMDVFFEAPGHVPTEKPYPLPGSMRVKFKASPKDSGAWKAAAARLAPSNRSTVYGLAGLLGKTIGPEYRVMGHEDYDPWLRIKPTLLSDAFRRPVLNCLKKLPAESRRRVHSYGLHWDISPTGQALKARVENAQAQNPDAESLRHCILQTLENSAWPCTPSGKAEAIQARICLGGE